MTDKYQFKSLKEAYEHFKSNVPRPLTAREELQARAWFGAGVGALAACINNGCDPVAIIQEANAIADSCEGDIKAMKQAEDGPPSYSVDLAALERLKR